MKKYFYKLLGKYLQLHILNDSIAVEINPKTNLLIKNLPCKSIQPVYFDTQKKSAHYQKIKDLKAEHIILNGNLHFERDIQMFLEQIHRICQPFTRILICYYAALWRPLVKIASLLRIRTHTPEQNWFSSVDLHNFAALSNFEVINNYNKILLPFNIPLISYFINRWIAPLPFFRRFTLVKISVLRPKIGFPHPKPSVSIVVAARNEEGNLESLVQRLPGMGNNDELIFVEGNSTDNTWAEIQRIQKEYDKKITIKIARQDGKGKGDAVRKGFLLAENEILMILDADMTVPPEELPKFYQAIKNDIGEFINGSRLVYPIEEKAMRFFNIIGNKFFALAFSFVLNQQLKDTLCGTKAITRQNYMKIAQNRSYFGNFDPFGDFDLIFGASRLGLKIVELPISYKTRKYGETNISRWKHGFILLRMLCFASRKIKFI